MTPSRLARTLGGRVHELDAAAERMRRRRQGAGVELEQLQLGAGPETPTPAAPLERGTAAPTYSLGDYVWVRRAYTGHQALARIAAGAHHGDRWPVSLRLAKGWQRYAQRLQVIRALYPGEVAHQRRLGLIAAPELPLQGKPR